MSERQAAQKTYPIDKYLEGNHSGTAARLRAAESSRSHRTLRTYVQVAIGDVGVTVTVDEEVAPAGFKDDTMYDTSLTHERRKNTYAKDYL